MSHKNWRDENAPKVRDRVLRVVGNGSWLDQANCLTADPALFYDTDTERSEARLRRIEQAKEVCWACIVRDECLDTALANEEQYGVWGGYTASERYRLTRAHRLA